MRRAITLGFTLLEMVIVLAVISILAATLTPIFMSYVARAKDNAARVDVKTIAAAILQYNTDTKIWPIYKTINDIPYGDAFDALRTVGNRPDVAPTIADWPIRLNSVNGTTSLDGMLNTNYFLLLTVGIVAFKGAYLDLGPDPWGGSYYITAANLHPQSPYAAYVISAGPNQTIETLYEQPVRGPLVVGGDDFVQRLR